MDRRSHAPNPRATGAPPAEGLVQSDKVRIGRAGGVRVQGDTDVEEGEALHNLLLYHH